VSGGVTPYSYSWNNGAFATEDLQGVPAGNYTVIVTDANGCVHTDSISLNQPPALGLTDTASLFPGNKNVSCHGATDGWIDITVSGGTPAYSFSWNNGAFTTEDLSNTGASAYVVVITDANNCTISDTITLTEPQPLSGSLSPSVYAGGWNVSCYGASDGSLDLTVNGGTAGYSFSWGLGASTEDLLNIPAGSYGVTITDTNGCMATVSLTLMEPPALSTGVSAQTFPGGWNISCAGASDGRIDLTVNGGTPAYIFNWNNGTYATEDISGLAGGFYEVTVTDSNGCTITDSITLNEPTPIVLTDTTSPYAGGWNVSCAGATDGWIDIGTSGGVSPYQFYWTTTSDTTADLTNITSGTYTLAITDNLGCTATTTVTLNEPTPLISGLSTSNYSGWEIRCFGNTDGSIDLTVAGSTPPYTYSWNNGQYSMQDLSNVGAGTYEVVITDANGCTTTSTATLTEPPALSAQLQPVDVICYGDSNGRATVQVNGGTGDYAYLWSHAGQSGPTANGLIAGAYSVVVTDGNNCQVSDMVVINQPPPVLVNAEPEHEIYLGDTVALTTYFAPNTGNLSYQWTGNHGLNCTNCPVPNASPTATTTYLVTAMNENGCQAIDSTLVRVLTKKALYVPNAFTPNHDDKNDIFHVYGEGIRKVRLRVFDRWGSKIFESNDLHHGWDGTYQGKELPPGVYVYTVHVEFLDHLTQIKSGSVTLFR